MNAGNSASNGKDVANVGFWQTNVLTYVRSSVAVLLDTLSKVISGELTPAALDFAKKAGSDVLSDKQMAEIARRLIVTFENTSTGNIVLSPTPPADLTKIWGQTDPTSGVLLGQLKKWDAEQEEWVPTVEAVTPYVPPKEAGPIRVAVPAGNQTVNVPLGKDMGTKDYLLSIVATTWNGESWGLPPVSSPTTNGPYVTNKTETEVTLAWYAIPTGGLTYELWARVPENP